MAALNGHADSVQLLLDLGACASQVTVEDGTTIDLIGNLLFSSCFSLLYAVLSDSKLCYYRSVNITNFF